MISDTCLLLISHSDISPWMLSCLPSYQSLIITLFYPTHPTVTHDLTIFSIRRRCRSVLDHLGCVFIHLLDFRFNIFYDGRAWQIVDLVVMIIFILTVGILSVDLFALCILSTDHYCCYSLVSFVSSVWCHDTWSCLALPIWGWTFSLHDNVITWWMNIF